MKINGTYWELMKIVEKLINLMGTLIETTVIAVQRDHIFHSLIVGGA